MTDTYTLLKEAGFSDDEILSEAGFGPDETKAAPSFGDTVKQVLQTAPIIGPLVNKFPARMYSQGGAMSALKGATLGFSDEIGANVEAGLGVAGDLLSGRVPIDRYDPALSGWRDTQQGFAKQNPGTANALEIVGALTTGAAKKAPAMVAEAAAYGFGTGEGGLRERAENALTSALISGGSQGALKGLGAAGGAIGNRIKRFGDAAELSAYSVTAADTAKAVKGGPGQYKFLVEGKHPTVEAFKTAKEMGVLGLGKSADPDTIVRRLEQPISDLRLAIRDELKAAQGALEPGESVMPKFTRAQRVVDSAAGTQGPAFQKILDAQKRAIKDKAGSNLLSLQDQKVAFNSKTYGANTVGKLKELDAAITADLKDTIEKRVDDLASTGKISKDLQGKIKELNRLEGDLLEVKSKLIPEAGKTFAQDIMKKAMPLMATTGGFGVPILVTKYGGGSNTEALGYGALGAALLSRQGRLAQAPLLRALGSELEQNAIDSAVNPLTRALVAGYN